MNHRQIIDLQQQKGFQHYCNQLKGTFYNLRHIWHLYVKYRFKVFSDRN